MQPPGRRLHSLPGAVLVTVHPVKVSTRAVLSQGTLGDIWGHLCCHTGSSWHRGGGAGDDWAWCPQSRGSQPTLPGTATQRPGGTRGCGPACPSRPLSRSLRVTVFTRATPAPVKDAQSRRPPLGPGCLSLPRPGLFGSHGACGLPAEQDRPRGCQSGLGRCVACRDPRSSVLAPRTQPRKPTKVAPFTAQ